MNSKNTSFQKSLEFGEKCINSCLLINGGAAIALLALLSTLISEHYPYSINFIIYALLAYLVGLLFAVAAYGIAFFAQEKVTLSKHGTLNKPAKRLRQITVALVIFSAAFFLGGGILASEPFLKQSKLPTNSISKNFHANSKTGNPYETQKLWSL